MRSSACKYLLDKVSKFEKKYAKPIQKTTNDDDDDLLSFKENNSLGHAGNQIKFIKSNATSRSHISQRLNEIGSLECDTRDDLNIETLPNSLQDTCKTNKKGRVHVMQKNCHMESPDASGTYEYNEDIKKINKTFLHDGNESLLTDKFNLNHSYEDVSQSTALNVKDSPDCAGHSLTDNLVLIKKEIENSVPEKKLTEDNEEEKVKKGHLHVNLNLKFDDPDDVSDISSKCTASLSTENSITSQNVPIHVFTFEDLIGAEELKSVSEELKGNLEETRQLNAETFSTADGRTNMLIADDLLHKSKSGDNGDDIHKTSRYSSEESLQEVAENVNESSIEEDIEEVIESSLSGKFNEASEQICSSSENIVSSDIKTKVKKNARMSEHSETNGENISRVDQYKENHSSNEHILDFVEDGTRHDVSLQRNKSELNHNVDNSENKLIKHKPKEFCEIKNHSGRDLKATSEKHYRLRDEDSKNYKHRKGKNHNREKYLENEWKLLRKNKNVLQNELRNAYTQTENFLAETYNFEKRMETIMKKSLSSMKEVNNITLEVNDIHLEQTSCSVSASSALERGFNCALKQQVELTKHFVCAEYNMYALCMAAIKEMSSSYKPATLHCNRKMKRDPSSKKASS